MRQLQITNVFEFGSGRSSAVLLRMGCNVVTLEGSPDWLEVTRREIIEIDQARWHPFISPPRLRWDWGVPFRSWVLDRDLRLMLAQAELVLIDSPVHPPSREIALLDTLRSGNNGVILMDDAGIPTVRRFCDRIRNSNSVLSGDFIAIDHGIYVLDARVERGDCVTRRGLVESAKGWRRFLSAG